ncbi:MAG: hypothetical protein O2807_09790, partial [bacterium]|nr:hypothetical protein [bacterium]
MTKKNWIRKASLVAGATFFAAGLLVQPQAAQALNLNGLTNVQSSLVEGEENATEFTPRGLAEGEENGTERMISPLQLAATSLVEGEENATEFTPRGLAEGEENGTERGISPLQL